MNQVPLLTPLRIALIDAVRLVRLIEPMKPGGTGIILALLLTMSLSCAQRTSSSDTGVKGVVTIRPIHPGPTREDVPDSGPLANCPFTVQNEKGVVASFTTDDQGQFRISLPPGHYSISMTERRARRCGPFEVDVVSGKMTEVAWRCDTGMR